MGRGARPGNEFTQKQVADRRRVERDQTAMTPVFPELRVVRTVQRDQKGLTDDWHMFLDDVGERNYGIGRAHALGSAAVVMVPAKEMGRMLQERYDRVYQSRERALEIQREVARNLIEYTREVTIQGYDEQTTDQERAYDRLQQSLGGVVFSNELGNYEDIGGQDSSLIDADEVIADPLPAVGGQLMMEAGTFDVKEVALFGKDGYALDLSGNDQLYDERSALIHHLRTEEGLDTSRLAKDGWAPHATFFKFEDHINRAPLTYQAELPLVIELNAVKPVVSKAF
ncbi:MAG TPA: hypothetical protein VK983_02595 [Candidatus Limnocylindrales bacterium]|nr:hypothetical protein [Candidatus Limnocylindrales bacterium]